MHERTKKHTIAGPSFIRDQSVLALPYSSSSLEGRSGVGGGAQGLDYQNMQLEQQLLGTPLCSVGAFIVRFLFSFADQDDDITNNNHTHSVIGFDMWCSVSL